MSPVAAEQWIQKPRGKGHALAGPGAGDAEGLRVSALCELGLKQETAVRLAQGLRGFVWHGSSPRCPGPVVEPEGAEVLC